jgi:hypothetical protein
MQGHRLAPMAFAYYGRERADDVDFGYLSVEFTGGHLFP